MAEGSRLVDWLPTSSGLKDDDGLFWLQGRFDLANELYRFAGGAQLDQTALAANLFGLNKGVAYVNGFNIGRYWLKRGICDGDCAPPFHGSHCYIFWKHCDEPTQYLYHIPFEMLLPKDNVITLFEETSPMRHRDFSKVSIEILRHHLA
jgi:hypothetical protein